MLLFMGLMGESESDRVGIVKCGQKGIRILMKGWDFEEGFLGG